MGLRPTRDTSPVSPICDRISAKSRDGFWLPNKALSSRDNLRFGTNGSVSVEIGGVKAGSWYDNENNVGGGPLEMLRVKGGMPNGAAIDWLKSELGIKIEPKNKAPLKIVATYDYRDETGNLLFQVCRLDPKDFRQRCPDGNGRWTWSVKGIRQVLYRLPELLAAPPDQLVLIPEGEKDVETLREGGFVATCNAGGAERCPEYAQFFQGRDIAILPDNDGAGRSHAKHIARLLLPVARSVRIVELPGLAPKGDVTDWTVAGNTPDQLRELIEAAAVIGPETLTNAAGATDDWSSRLITTDRWGPD